MRDILCFTLSFFNKETTVGGITETVEYVYNPFNQLVQFKDKDGNITNYVYDGNGRRVQKSDSSTVIKYYWSGDYVINETISSVSNLDDIVNVSNHIDSDGIFARTAGEDYYQYLKDNHGDVVETRKNGTSYTVYYYDAFGFVEDSDFTNENPVGYVGEYFDAESGLIYLRNRYYDPSMGRFISEDPIKDGLNWYVYCSNNPVMFVDPSGMIKEGDEKLNESIQIILNGTKKDGSGGLSLAWSLASSASERKTIEETADKIRGFNADNINRHMILLNSSAALGAGHTATLLLNENNQGLLFSYYSENGKAVDNGQMRIAFLNSSDWNNLLYKNKSSNFAASNGTIQSESYNGNLYLRVSSSNGQKGLAKIAELYNNPSKYNLAMHNCDHMTSSVASAAGIFYDKRVTPNDSFTYTRMYHTSYWLWILDAALKIQY